MIVDTSAWVECLRATGSPTHLTLRAGVQDGKPIATPALVVTELLSGSRSEAAGLLQLLSRFEILIPDSLRDYQGAARVQRICRRAGFTIRSTTSTPLHQSPLRLTASPPPRILLRRSRPAEKGPRASSSSTRVHRRVIFEGHIAWAPRHAGDGLVTGSTQEDRRQEKTMDFYSSSGAPIAYSDDGEHIYLFSGKPVAYFSGTAVYTFSGKHIGWFDNGWIRDLDGYAVFFTSAARGGPVKPVRQIKPVKGVKNVRPVKGDAVLHGFSTCVQGQEILTDPCSDCFCIRLASA